MLSDIDVFFLRAYFCRLIYCIVMLIFVDTVNNSIRIFPEKCCLLYRRKKVCL